MDPQLLNNAVPDPALEQKFKNNLIKRQQKKIAQKKQKHGTGPILLKNFNKLQLLPISYYFFCCYFTNLPSWIRIQEGK